MDKIEIIKYIFLSVGVILLLVFGFNFFKNIDGSNSEEIASDPEIEQQEVLQNSNDITDFFENLGSEDFVSDDVLSGGGCIIRGDVVKDGSVKTDTVCVVQPTPSN
jgi:hypothetical protein